MQKINVMIVDISPIFRLGIRFSFEETFDIRVVAEAATEVEAMHVMETSAIHVLITSFDGPADVNSVKFTRDVRRSHPAIAVITLSTKLTHDLLYTYVPFVVADSGSGYNTKSWA